jgi:GNAT superfamily N-acetyltransferase
MTVVTFRYAGEDDIAALVGLRLRVDAEQERRFGGARWSTTINQNSVARGLKTGRVLLALQDGTLIGAVRIEARKPWAFDLSYFTPVAQALYLHDVNIEPALQGRGHGARLIEEVKSRARDWPADAIRADTFDGAAGASAFYRKCGFKAVGRKTYRSVPLAYFELLLTA